MIDLILATLATWRIALMLATEEGTFGVFAWVRERIDPQQTTWLGRGINCPYCISFWIALGWALLLAHQTPTMGRSETLLAWFGIAGGAALLQKLTE